MEFIIGLYLVGYFISTGIGISFKEDNDSYLDTIGAAVLMGLLSWILIGIVIGEFWAKGHKKESQSSPINKAP